MTEYETHMVILTVLTYANSAGILLVTILDKKKYSDGNLTDTQRLKKALEFLVNNLK